MVDDEEPRLVALVSKVMKYHRQGVTPDLLEMWWEGLRRFELVDIQRAMNAHTFDPDRGQFPPKIADLVRVLQGTSSDRAVAAWGKVYDSMGSAGAYRDVAFDDAVIHAVVSDMGGWPKLCRWPIAEISYAQHTFTKSYASLSQFGCEGYPRVLIGDCDPASEYVRRGLTPPTPLLIGDPVKAALVVAGGGAPRVKTTELPPGTSVADLVRLGGGIGIHRLTAGAAPAPADDAGA